MSCTVCGSSTRCGCNQTIVGVVQASCETDCCQPTVQANPAPFYQCAPACVEGHQQKIIIESFRADVKVASSWNVPVCEGSAVISVPGLKSITIGSYIWNPGVGYFEVTAFNPTFQEITVVNHCTTGNAAPGTSVASCTEFTVTDPPCDCNTTGDVCVAIDFTAPANGVCLDITLTSTTGLTPSDTVQIGSGFYFLEAIKPNNVVTICNQGDGITPGTSVIAKDANGNYQYCLSIISENPCDRTALTEGTVLVCDGDGVTAPITGANGSYVLTLTDPATGTADYRPLDAVCTNLTIALGIVNGTASYTLTVSSSSGFAIGDIVHVDGYGALMEITGVPNATQLTGDFDPVPAANTTIPIGAQICQISCCQKLATEIACLPAVAIGPVALQFYSIPLVAGDYTQTEPAPGVFTGQKYETVVGTLVNITETPTDCPDAEYYVKAVVSTIVLPNHDTGIVMHEVELRWDNQPPPHQNGKMVWTDFGSDGFDISPLYPVTSDNACWGNMSMQAAGPLESMQYHGNDINAIVTNVPPATIMNLEIHYKSCIGDSNGPTTIDGVLLMTSGLVEIYRST